MVFKPNMIKEKNNSSFNEKIKKFNFMWNLIIHSNLFDFLEKISKFAHFLQ